MRFLPANQSRRLEAILRTSQHLALALVTVTPGLQPNATQSVLGGKLALSASPDTVLRRTKSASQECRRRPRYVGLEDWALRKGQVYGTILIDLERGTVIDLFPGRDGEALKNWLSTNPQVGVITRDRWPAYIEAATTAAPQAKQVADRFHLLCNVREAIEKVLSQHGDEIRIVSAAVNREEFSQDSAREAPVASEEPTLEPRTEKDARREDKRPLREDHFMEVKELTARGEPCRKIARLLGADIRVSGATAASIGDQSGTLADRYRLDWIRTLHG